ncbi:response regulator [Lignipirellula cremea]|uniref:response regulator n=1 Tax=Lignipirellula cremea TaxID=2528010 RepID=UPI0018D206D7|nr:response regulator [Lignipirellula cremea]
MCQSASCACAAADQLLLADTNFGAMSAPGDLLICLACAIVGGSLAFFLWRRPDAPFRPLLMLFSAFFFACGLKHLAHAASTWNAAEFTASDGIAEAVWWCAHHAVALLALITALGLLWTLRRAVDSIESLRKENFIRQAAEKEAESQRRFSQNVLDSLSDHVAVVNSAGEIVLLNETWRRFAKENQEATCVGHNFVQQLADNDSIAAKNAAAGVWESLRTHQGAQQVEYAMDYGDQRRWFLLNASPLGVGAGAVISRVEISERKRTEETLTEYVVVVENSRREAESANLAKSRFLANMSHELRTPMTAVIGVADLMLREEKDPQRRDMLKMIRENGNRLTDLLNDILDISKIEANRFEIKPKSYSPGAVAAEVVSLMERSASDKGVSLQLVYETPVPCAATFDPLRVRQVLANLVGNAVKFTEEGVVVISVAVEGETLLYTVSDTGPGISLEEQAMLFEPFTQSEHTRSQNPTGAGLGLAICSAITEMMNGRIWVESELGAGSRFCFAFHAGPLDDSRWQDSPSMDDCTPLCEPDTLAEATSSFDYRILVAEDVPATQFLLKQLLQLAGAQVTVAEDGEQVLELVEQSPADYDVILMDMQMPRLDGFDATRRLRDTGCTTPIIALTASVMASERQQCLRVGCNDFLGKPFDQQDLFDKISDLMESREAAAEAGSA